MIRLEPNRRSIAHFSLSYCTSLQKNIFFGTGSKHFETPAYLIFDHGVRPKSNFDLAPFSKVIFLAEFVKILRILSSHLANSHHLASVWPGKNHSRSASRNETFGSVLHVSGFFFVFFRFFIVWIKAGDGGLHSVPILVMFYQNRSIFGLWWVIALVVDVGGEKTPFSLFCLWFEPS